MSESGIYSALVSGKTVPESSEDESWPIYWNLVHADGSYYYTNVFRDDPEIQDDPSFAFHTYFNLDYEEISESHTPTDGTLIPLSDNEFNYYKEAGLTADSGEKLTALFEKLIEDAVSRETTGTENYIRNFLRCPDTVYNSMLSAIRSVNSRMAESGTESGKKLSRLLI